MEDLTLQLLHTRLLAVTNQNTRRKYTVALRSLFRDQPWIGSLKIPKASPRVYDLPDEDSLRFALMLSPFELQGLLMMYGGLRVGESCAVRPTDLRGNVLKVHRQRYSNGQLVTAKTVGEVVIPDWLAIRIETAPDAIITPGSVRESLRRYGRKAGIELSPHMLSHWYATMLVNRRINPEIARRQMRHADLKTTLGYYAQVSKDDIDRVVTDLFE
ncbi:tyrosine-type recombinase/integrase [Motilibacter aurantiacus]|uniref:tyrosine-type recombinase/integrase n=1 Tax=Motilibacter aurantiacus TaxID=2714955 RepID=UPI001E5A574C|nr:site-specific integrase [Motilibacter aurantiacus]